MQLIHQKESLISAIQKIDWNFPGSTTLQSTVHSLHWFPGNFIPQIPSYLIQLLSQEGDIIFDPFCGSGTTGVEALRLKRHSLQSDVNKTSIQVSCGKIAAYTNPSIKNDLIKLQNKLLLGSMLQHKKVELKNKGIHPELTKWFHKDTYRQLLYIWHLIESIHNRKTREVLEVIFSDTLFACASTDGAKTSTGGKRRHHWGWVADNVVPSKPVQHDAIKLFNNRLFLAIEIISLDSKISKHKSYVFRGDSREIGLNDSSVDLVVTSPPYISMIDYTLANRLHYFWMDWSIPKERKLEIGARFRRQNKNVISEYLSSMTQVSKEIRRILKPQKYCAIIIGASRKYPDVAEEIIRLFTLEFRKVCDPIKRIPSRRRVSEKQGTDMSEYICIFQNHK